MRRFAASARSAFRSVWLILAVGLVLGAAVVHTQPAWAQEATPFTEGEVFVGLGLGKIGRYSPDGTLIATLDKGPDVVSDAGMDFDASGNLYAANYQSAIGVSKFDNTGALIGPFGSGYTLPESIVVDDAGNVYVGQDDGELLKFAPSGALIASFTPESPGNDQSWIDLAPDQCTLYYTGGAPVVKRFDVCTGVQLDDFATLPDGFTHNVRALPNGDVLVAQDGRVFRIHESGFVVRVYTVPGTLNLGLDLDASGTAFWTTDWYTGVTAKIDIATGTVLASFVAAPGQDFGRFGLAVFGASRGTTGSIHGAVYAGSAAPANALGGVELRACALPAGACHDSEHTTAAGHYVLGNLAPGDYEVRIYPSEESELLPAAFTATVGVNEQTIAPDAVLHTALVPPAAVTLDPATEFLNGVPLLPVGKSFSFEYFGCVGADPLLSEAFIRLPNGNFVEGDVIPLPVVPLPGVQFYSIRFDSIPVGTPTGPGRVVVVLACPGSSGVSSAFDVWVYVDPSGIVRSTAGGPVTSAAVTLLRSDSASGPFAAVPDGSLVMSPENRVNPDTTEGDGRFAWDVVAGYYKVRAERPGCFAPGNPTQTFVETDVLTIPPPVTGLELVLECEDETAPGTTASAITGGAAYTFGSWTNDSVVLALDPTDGGSGVTSTFVGIDEPGCAPATPEACFTYPGPFEITADGAHTVTFFSRDAHGNTEPAQTISVRIDRTGPAVAFRYDPETRKIAVTGRDTLSGLANLTTTSLSGHGGQQRLQTAASDLAGNVVTVDWSSPRSGLEVRVDRIDGAPAAANHLRAQPANRRLKQHAELGRGPDRITVDAAYNGTSTEITRRTGSAKTRETRPGLALLSLIADASGIAIEY
jgi:hypothetical protein